MVEWYSVTERNNFHQSDAASRVKATLYSTGSCASGKENKIHIIYRVKSSWPYIPFSPDTVKLHEVWMVYFPVAVLDSGKEQRYQFPKLLNFFEGENEHSNPMAGILRQTITGISGTVEYQGIRCQRIVWFMEWKSKEAEELYKRSVRWVREDSGKGEPQLTLNMFIEDLKSLGMVRCETWHAQFEQL